jgi:hypothetical protein
MAVGMESLGNSRRLLSWGNDYLEIPLIPGWLEGVECSLEGWGGTVRSLVCWVQDHQYPYQKKFLIAALSQVGWA